MKTVYIPAGATCNYETLVTDDVIVHGHLHVTNGSESESIFPAEVLSPPVRFPRTSWT